MKYLITLLFILSYAQVALAQNQCDPKPQNPILLPPADISIEDIISHEELKPSDITVGARSGGWSGNGGDLSEVNDNIWYLGSERISYCVKSSEDFILSTSEQVELIESSIKEWKQFFKKYDLLGNLLTDQPRRGNSRISFLDNKNRSINFNFKYNTDCRESKLAFYFGKENKLISDYKKFATEHPYGFAVRKSYDHESYSNLGIVWIKNIKDVFKIKHTVLHELGHVMGMSHDSVYIMRSTMASDFEKSLTSKDQAVNSIESSSWPYRFSSGNSLMLSMNKTKRPGRIGCKVSGAFMLRKGAKAFRSLIKARENHCLSIEATAKQLEGDKQLTLMLKITNHSTGKVKNISGKFGSKRKTLRAKKGPGLFTKFLHTGPRGTKEVWKKVFLDKAANNEAFGSFSSGRYVFPAKLTQEKGAILDLYIPQSNKWITVKSYHN